jgi:hypothetical protein
LYAIFSTTATAPGAAADLPSFAKLLQRHSLACGCLPARSSCTISVHIKLALMVACSLLQKLPVKVKLGERRQPAAAAATAGSEQIAGAHASLAAIC